MPFVTLALWFTAVALAVSIWHDVPVIDDWTYAWTVEHLLRTGTFGILDWSSAYPLSQAVWGAAWSAVLGFSFTTLTLSTLVLGAAASYAVFLLLRELGSSPHVALLGALSVAVNPLFVFLSSSFMTDVPFIAFTTLALLCYVRAMNRGEPHFLWWAGAWAVAAFLTRQIGLITPVAGLPLLLTSARPTLRRSRVALSLFLTWTAMIGLWVAMRQQLGVTTVMQRWASNVYAGPADYALLGPYFLVLISFYLLPALLADASIRGLWRRPWLIAGMSAVAALLLLIVHGGIPLPLLPDQTWSLYELGSSRALVNGEFAESTPAWAEIAARAAGLAALTLFLLVAVRGVDSAGLRRTRSERSEAFRLRTPIAIWIAAYLVLVNLLWMYNDRYYLVLLPLLVALILGGHSATVGRLRLATSALLMFAVIALVGTRDAQRFNQAVRDASQTLLDAGIPASEIDAGYAWNGWMLYAHPVNLAPGMTPLRDVPWVTSGRKTQYMISKGRDVDGYVVEREVSWQGLPWPGRNRLFVLKQQRTADAAVSAATADTQ